jgi:hypothetical protein
VANTADGTEGIALISGSGGNSEIRIYNGKFTIDNGKNIKFNFAGKDYG